jgi:hypothetical protein
MGRGRGGGRGEAGGKGRREEKRSNLGGGRDWRGNEAGLNGTGKGKVWRGKGGSYVLATTSEG